MQEAVLFPFLFRLIRLRGGSFLQELYDFEKILAVKKVNTIPWKGRNTTGKRLNQKGRPQAAFFTLSKNYGHSKPAGWGFNSRICLSGIF
jgi:hypothetical protein